MNGDNIILLSSELDEDDQGIYFFNETHLHDDIHHFHETSSINKTLEDLNLPYDFDKDQIDVHEPGSIFVTFSTCSDYRQIDVAIAFDSSFCSWMGGYEASSSRVQSIVALAATKFQQTGLCVTLRLSAIDGFCDYGSDEYKNMPYYNSGCTSGGG